MDDCQIIDGKKIAKDIRDEISREVTQLRKERNTQPGLGVILVGDNPASQTYVANKTKAACECGFNAFDKKFPSTVSQKEVSKTIQELNEREDIHGILLQLPLPPHLDSFSLISEINPKKDADGLHPFNQGLLLQGKATLKPCTPLGVIELLKRTQIEIQGKKAIIIGRSILVGKPLSLLLLDENATVTIAHSKTRNIESEIHEADIVIAALGIPEFVRGDWIKEGALVIDVGINRTPDGKLVGDVNFQEVSKRASAITPVPGGVGPMTIAMLLKNTFNSYKDLAS